MGIVGKGKSAARPAGDAWPVLLPGRPAAMLALPLLVATSLMVATCGGGTAAQAPEDTDDRFGEETTTARLDPDDPLVQDAKMYAKDQDIPLEEAVRRLQLQDSVGELGAELEANERDTFAGLWVQHEPEYRVVVAFTRDGKETVRPYVEGGPLEDVVEVREAPATLMELQEPKRGPMNSCAASAYERTPPST